MKDDPALQALQHQFGQASAMLRSAIESFTEEAWCSGVTPSTTPARLAYHAVETVDFYAGDDAEGFPWGAVGGDWEADDAAPPRKDVVAAYLARVEEKVRGFLEEGSAEDASAPDAAFPWFPNRVTRALYSLRHLQQSVGELNQMLKQAGLRPAEWR